MKERALLVAAALVLSACADDQATGPNIRPSYDHAEPPQPPAEINVNNYDASFQLSGLVTTYKGSSALFTGGLAYGTDVGTVHFVNTAMSNFDVAQTGLPVDLQQPGAAADLYSATVMTEQPAQDLGAKSPLGIVTVRETYSFTSAPDDDYLIVKYSLTNTTSNAINGLQVGYMADPDLDDFVLNQTGEAGRNIASYDAATQTARVIVNGGQVQHAIAVLSHGVGAYQAWRNGVGVFPAHDPTDLAGWWAILSGGIASGTQGPADVRQYLGTPVMSLAPGETKVVAFALAGGDNAADATANIAAARTRSAALLTPVPAERVVTVIQAGSANWTARLTFRNSALAAQFNPAQARCGGAQVSSHATTGNIVDVMFPALGLDVRRTSGAYMHCAGRLNDGTYYAGTDRPTFTENTIPVTQLTTTLANVAATWSPDGSQIAFVSTRNGGGLFTMDASTGEASVTQITVGTGFQQPSWSVNGTIAYTRSNQILAVPATGGTPVLLNANGTDPRYSPDGSRIAFRRTIGTVTNIMVMNADGSGEQAVTTGTTFSGYMEWIDNNKLVFTRIVTSGVDEAVYTMEIGNPASLTRITPAETGTFRWPDLSPDGKTLAFVAGAELILQDMQSGLHTIAMMSPAVLVNSTTTSANVEFSPDGTKILFNGFQTGTTVNNYVMPLPQAASPAERTEELSLAIDELIADGLVSSTDGAQLADKLDQVAAMIASGNVNSAVNHVNAFINKVRALVNSRRMNEITGDQLTSESNLLVQQLQSYSN